MRLRIAARDALSEPSAFLLWCAKDLASQGCWMCCSHYTRTLQHMELKKGLAVHMEEAGEGRQSCERLPPPARTRERQEWAATK